MFLKVAISSALKCFPLSAFWPWERRFATPILGRGNKSETWSCSGRNFAAKEHVEFAENEGEDPPRSPPDAE